VLLLMTIGTGCKHPAASFPALKPTATGAAIVVSSGDKQAGPAGTELANPLVVQVNDDQGNGVTGALVEFHGPPGVLFDPAAVLTDSSGQATTAVRLGTIGGRYELSATTPGKAHAVTLQVAETALGYQQQLGSILADKYCSRCHDPESSAAQVSNYDNLAVKPHTFTDGNTLNKMSDADLLSIIQHGGPALNRSALMPPYGSTLNPAEVQAIIAYIRVVADPPYRPAGTVYGQK
jgi:mono/diheme cytochrome c family protein